MKENTLSYTTRIGKTTFIVNVKQSESAKKPLNTVFQEICRHEFVKMIFASFLNSNIYPLKNLPTSRVCIFLEIPYSKASLREAQLQAEKEAREKARQERIKERRNKRGMER